MSMELNIKIPTQVAKHAYFWLIGKLILVILFAATAKWAGMPDHAVEQLNNF